MIKKIGRLLCLLLVAAFIFVACGREELLLENDFGEQEKSLAEVTENNMVTEEPQEMIYIHVCGAVLCPGVYELEAGSRVCDVVGEAGGLLEDADEEAVNLVKVLSDGEQIRIPYLGEEGKLEDDGLIDINQADVKLLCEIPGIGESRAEAIIAYREENGAFQKTEDLMLVPGIKEGLFARMVPYIECR